MTVAVKSKEPEAPPVIEAPSVVWNETAHRVHDLQSIPWLLPRLTQEYPHIGHWGWNTLLRGIMTSNEYLFVCNSHAVALAQLKQETLDPIPIVNEIFVLAEGGPGGDYTNHALALYDDVLRFAQAKGASEIHFDVLSDAPRPSVSKKLARVLNGMNNIKILETIFARIK